MFGFFKRKSRTPESQREPGAETASDAQQTDIPVATPDRGENTATIPAADVATSEAGLEAAPRAAEAADERTGAPEGGNWLTRLKSSVGLGGKEPTPTGVPAPAPPSPTPPPPAVTSPPAAAPTAPAAPPESQRPVVDRDQTATPAPDAVEGAPPVSAAPDVPASVPQTPPAPPTALEPVPAMEPAPAPQALPAESGGWFSRLREGLSKTRDQLGGQLVAVFGVGRKLDEAFYEELETVLLTSDVGVPATEFLIDNLRTRARKGGFREASQLREALGDLLLEMLEPLEQPLDVSKKKPFVIMLAGVNGSGKTTSIGKLAHYYGKQGRKVLLAAGDTFRAAAREQLVAWGERNNVTVVTSQSGDAAAVIFDAINAAVAREVDVVLADTAGRLPTQLHLMDEIRKVKRVVDKALPGAPHEVLLVLDANTGQNALAQVKAFDDALGVTGLVMTKLDGTAKGGVIAAIAHTRSRAAGRPIPLRFVGVGEGLNDLRPFNAEDFVAALVGDDDA